MSKNPLTVNPKLKEIIGSVDELAIRGKISRSRAFAAWFVINFFHLDEDDALEAAAADGGSDQGLDIVFIDETSQELIAIQAHCPENFANKTPKSKWDSIVTSIPFLKSPDLLKQQGRPDIAETIESAKQNYPEHTLTVGLISLGVKSLEIEASLKAHEKNNPDGINYFYYNQEDLISSYSAIVESEGGIPEDDLHFSGAHFEDSGEYGRAWVGSVSGEELKRLHSTHKDKLFAGNIRLFLGSRKGGINEQIIRTAKQAPGTFWALNNGITIVADYATLSKRRRRKLDVKT